jgi:GNAT superfamily N-acetyltransferase
MGGYLVKVLTPREAEAQRAALADILVDAVESGASVNFVLPMTRAKADAWWAGALASQARGERMIFAAETDGQIDGTVQLILAPQENQRHRADIGKMLVHRRARRQGLGAMLLGAAEAEAKQHGRSLLTLDTVTGGDAERLYLRCGWQRFGVVPGFATSADGGRREDCSFFYKTL